MSDPDIVGSFTSEPTITGQFEPDIVIQGNVDQQFPAQISVASVTTGDPGTDASVVNVGTPGNARLQFTIPRGNPGDIGPANSLSIGTVESGTSADATITGTAPSQTLNLTLPQGDPGDAATIAVGTVTSVANGSPATVENVGTDTAAVFNFGIPEGDPGVVQSLVAGSNITIDATDPANPIINSTASGSGDVVGPASAVDGTPAVFDGTTGKLLKNITYGAFKTLLSLVKGDVGLGNVDNTADSAKNVLSATKLTTARNIDGQSFDGSASITVIAPGTHAATGKTTPVDADEFAIVDSAASNVLKKLTWANLKATVLSYLVSNGYIRDKLSADRTYYVLTTGSDSNTGLANTSGGAFLTGQKAINVVAALDISTFNVTIQFGAGTYTGNISVTGPWVGSGNVTLTGDTTTPSNVVFSATGTAILASSGARLNVQGFKLTSTDNGVRATSSSIITLTDKMEFGANSSYGMLADAYGEVLAAANFSITGGGFAAFGCNNFGTINVAGRTAALSGTPAYGAAFASASVMGLIVANSFAFTGSATGARYSATTGGGIFTFGGGANVFPGNATGTATSPGWYN